MDKIKDIHFSDNDVDTLSSSFELDLLSWYKQVEEAAIDLVGKAEKEGWTPEELMAEIDKLLSDTPEQPVAKSWELQNEYEFGGLPIAVENATGSIREGVDQDGNAWQTHMLNDYGYIKGIMGADGDELDCFIGPNRGEQTAYVIHIKDPETGLYDEDKVFLGFLSGQEALDVFNRHYDDPERFYAGMTITTIDALKGGCMPVPGFSESENEFISRCVKEVMGEGATQDQAIGKCYGIWSNRGKVAKTLKIAALPLPSATGFPRDVDQMAEGIRHEMREHDISVLEATKMADDHLRRDSQYYSKLKSVGLM